MKLEELIGDRINGFWWFQVEKGMLTESEASSLVGAMEVLLHKLRGCLLCYLIGEREYHFTSRLQYAIIQEPSLLEDFRGQGGFCHAHACYLQDMTSPAANATLYRSLIEAIGSRLQGLTPQTLPREKWKCSSDLVLAGRPEGVSHLPRFGTIREGIGGRIRHGLRRKPFFGRHT